MKTIWDDFANKIKVLLGKTENDDKLITMLKAEISKLKTNGGKASPHTVQTALDGSETLYSLKNDNAKLWSDIFVVETEV